MAGRPRKSTKVNKKHLTKAEKRERELAEERTKLERDTLLANAEELVFYDEASKEEYKRVIIETAKIDLLDNLDQAYLKMYADAWSIYNQAVKDISDNGITVRVPVGDSGSKLVKNPALNAYNDAVKTINQCSTKLGLATTDRLKLQVPKGEEKPVNKFAKFAK